MPLTAHPPLPSSFQAAFTRLEATVSEEDARTFQHTTLEDVWTSVREVEKRLQERQQSRALRRIESFLKGINQYADVMGVLCNGTPYLPWIWVHERTLGSAVCITYFCITDA